MRFQEIIDTLPTHILDKLYELKDMRERPDYHPEPSVFHHIEIVTKRAIEYGDKNLICSAIFHDIHKKDTMKINPKTGHPTSPGHDKWARKTIENDGDVRKWIIDFGACPDVVGGVCGDHMRIHQFSLMRTSKQMAFMEVDHFGILSVFACFDDMLVTDEESLSNARNAFDNHKDYEWMKSFGKHGVSR